MLRQKGETRPAVFPEIAQVACRVPDFEEDLDAELFAWLRDAYKVGQQQNEHTSLSVGSYKID
jgi:hypothetical protein